MDYRYGSHTVYNIEYHFVWVTKYRYKVLTGDVALRVRELVRQTCAIFEIKMLTGVVREGSCAHPGLCSASHGSERDHAPDQRTEFEQAVRGVPTAEEALLGTALLGPRVFLCHGGVDDRRDDQRVCAIA